MKATLEIVDQLASGQLSLVTREQLVDAGVSRHEIASLLRAGTLRRRAFRVYGTLGAPESWERKLLARVLGAGRDGLASHGAAARLWIFSHRPERDLEVLIEADRVDAQARRTR